MKIQSNENQSDRRTCYNEYLLDLDRFASLYCSSSVNKYSIDMAMFFDVVYRIDHEEKFCFVNDRDRLTNHHHWIKISSNENQHNFSGDLLKKKKISFPIEELTKKSDWSNLWYFAIFDGGCYPFDIFLVELIEYSLYFFFN